MRTKDPDKQQRIKEAMVQLFLREGINGASVSKIAKEAGVSPATIYVYYSNKEEMLSEVFKECAHESYAYLKRRVEPDMSAGDLLEAIVYGYYAYATEHEEVFSFIEQCSRCPTLGNSVSHEECTLDIFDIIHEYQDRGEIKKYRDMNIAAVLFAPVKFIAMNCCAQDENIESQLAELATMLKKVLLV